MSVGVVPFTEAFVAWLGGRAAVAALLSASTAIFPAVAPASAEFPYIVFHYLSDPDHYHLGGVSAIRSPLLQVECWAERWGEATALADAVEAEMSGFRGVFGAEHIHGTFKRDRSYRDEERGDATEKRNHAALLDFELWRAT